MGPTRRTSSGARPAMLTAFSRTSSRQTYPCGRRRIRTRDWPQNRKGAGLDHSAHALACADEIMSRKAYAVRTGGSDDVKNRPGKELDQDNPLRCSIV